MLKIRRPLGRLIFNMGIAIPGKTVFLIETAPRFPLNISQGTLNNTIFVSLNQTIYNDNSYFINSRITIHVSLLEKQIKPFGGSRSLL